MKVLFLCAALSSIAFEGVLSAQLQQDASGSINIAAATISDVVRIVSRKLDQPIGVEIRSSTYPGQTVALHFPGGSTTALFDAIASLQPGWSWVKDSTGNVIFRTPESTSSLTDLSFSSAGMVNASRKQLWDELGSRPEIQSWLAANGCTRLEVDTGKRWQPQGALITIKPSETTIETFVANASKLSSEKFWSISWIQGDQGCYVSIAF